MDWSGGEMDKFQVFFNSLSTDERRSLMTFARVHMAESLFGRNEDLSSLSPELQKYYRDLWTKLDFFTTRAL